MLTHGVESSQFLDHMSWTINVFATTWTANSWKMLKGIKGCGNALQFLKLLISVYLDLQLYSLLSRLNAL